MDQDLKSFVRDALLRGQSRAAIRAALEQAGWRAGDVDAALEAWAEGDFPVPVPRRRPYLPARIAFLHLVLFATLWTTAYHVGQLLFALIERWLPDAASPGDGRLQYLRDSVASLLIAFPVFLFVNRIIERSFAREPEQRGSAVRKWLIYLTLFLAALVLIGDLIFLVTRLLSGELPPRVLLKVLVVFLIAGTVFWHYLGDLQGEEAAGERARRAGPLARAAAVAVGIVALAGLVAIGTPGRARQETLDEMRSGHLLGIAQAVDEWHRDRGTLPDSLGALLEPPGTAYVPAVLDPVSREPYGYRIVDSTTYELCATFDRERRPDRRHPEGAPTARFWTHGAGRTCFTLRPARAVRPPR